MACGYVGCQIYIVGNIFPLLSGRYLKIQFPTRAYFLIAYIIQLNVDDSGVI